ncbi:MAG: P-II family nitrogen regulator [Clostridiales Family XIII bacterium]|jgi:nitrogen regulatory protein PII|nr:P-II family nitrogen regulator [Clostridiales Family XIII bacterium]
MADYSNTEYSLILTIVNRGYAELVMDAARDSGARGGTVLYARGTGIHATEKFMNIDIQPEKEIVLTIVNKTAVRQIMHAILEAGGLKTKGRGISFSLPVTDLVGFSEEDSAANAIEIFEEEERQISDR